MAKLYTQEEDKEKKSPNLPSTPKLTNKQKAAVVLIALGPEISSLLLKHFDEIEVEQIAYEISTLKRVDPFTVNDILEEFYQLAKANELMAAGGVDYTRDVLTRAFGEEKANRIIDKLLKLLEATSLPFENFRKVDPAHIANILQNEHPQTIALILAYLKPEQAAVVVAQLPEELQFEVSKRLATLERAGLDVVRDIETVIQSKFSSLLAPDKSAEVGGVKALAEVLNRVDRSTERNIMENLERYDPELAESVKKLMFVFDDIVQLDDRSIQKVLKEVETKDLALAMKTASEEVKSRIFKNMSERAALMLQEDMEVMGPVRLKDVEETQTKIVNIIRKLEEAGEITIARGGEDIVI